MLWNLKFYFSAVLMLRNATVWLLVRDCNFTVYFTVLLCVFNSVSGLRVLPFIKFIHSYFLDGQAVE